MSKFMDGRNFSFWVAKQPTDITTVQYHELPRVSGDFEKARTYADDETMTKKRESKDSVLTGSSVAGDFTANIRLSENYKELRQGAFQAFDATPVAITAALTYTHSTTTLAGADFSAISAGDYFGVVLTGGEVKVVLATADGTGTDILIAGLTADATATEARAEKYVTSDNAIQFMMQKRAEGTDGDGGPAKTFYRTFTGVEVLTYTVSLAQESILTESFGMTGLTLLDGEDLPTQGSDIVYPETQVLGAVKGVKEIWFDGAKRQCFAQSFEFSLDNSGSEAKALGQEGACAISYGNPIVTSQLSVYSLKSDPYEYHKLADSQELFPLAVVKEDVSTGKIMIISGNAKSTTVDGAPETGPQVTSLSVKFVGDVALTYI